MTTLTQITTGLGLGVMIAAGPAHAQTSFPDHAMKLVVPFAPGGAPDVVARIIAGKMGEELKQPVVIENRDGAGGAVGTAFVANAPADGYTMAISGIGAPILLPAMGNDTGFDMESDFRIVGSMGTLGLMLAARPSFEPRTFEEFVAYATEHPGDVAYGSSGVGTPGHLAMEVIAKTAGLDLIHIPYRGSIPQLNDLLGDHLDVGVLTIPGTAEQVEVGALTGYATTASEREPLLPGMPTVGEAPGFQHYALDLWNLLIVPKGTPEDVVARLSEALIAAMEDPAIVESLRLQSVRADKMSPDEATEFYRAERDKWTKIVQETDLTK